jgi:hypothetical protein
MLSNYQKGNNGEQTVQSAFRVLDWDIKPHRAQDKDIDLVGFRHSSFIAGETINWKCGGYIHPKRFDAIVKSLLSIDGATERWLFCFGVNPTSQQKITLKMLNINLLTAPYIEEVNQLTINHIVNLLKETKESVITSYTSYSTLFNNLISSGFRFGFEGVIYQNDGFHAPFSFEKDSRGFNCFSFLVYCGLKVGSFKLGGKIS